MDSNTLSNSTRGLVSHLENLYKDWPGVKQFGETPERLTRMYQEFCWSPQKIEKELSTVFRTFENGYNEMLTVKDIHVWTLCPHHLLPCEFRVSIGYVPNGRVLGLSKFARVAEILSKRPIMQEEYSTELCNRFMDSLKPKGVAVYCVGNHGCMTARGVKQHSEVVTSIVTGVFESEPETRAEFYSICRS